MSKFKKIAEFILLLLLCSQLKAGSPYIGEIRIFAGNFPPLGWAFCDGQQLSIAENDAFFNLIGTTYGGDGLNTFAVPDLRGRVPISVGQGYGLSNRIIGEMGGTEEVTLFTSQMPSHSHPLLGSTAKGDAIDPSNAIPAKNSIGVNQYSTPTGQNGTQAGMQTISNSGSNQPHNNIQPYLGCNYIIALYGIFPSQSKASKYDGLQLNLDGSLTKADVQRSSETYLSEISIFAFPFAPRGYATCSGQLIPINQNQALFSLLGTNYGGNGQTNFALPDIRGRVPVGIGQGNGLRSWTLGEMIGEENHTLTIPETPAHNHKLAATTSKGNHDLPAGKILALDSASVPSYVTSQPTTPMNNTAVQNTGGSQRHNNTSPYLSLNFCIALVGVFPSPNKDNESPSRNFDPYVAEISIFPFNFAPRGFMPCNGQLYPIAQNTALFSLLGTTYGGNGQSNFALPDLRGRMPVHTGYSNGPGLSYYDLGMTGGEESTQLLTTQIPAHNHGLLTSSISDSDTPANKTFGQFAGNYSSEQPNTNLHNEVIGYTGGSSPHNNIMPSLGLNFCIATQGIFPPHNFKADSNLNQNSNGGTK